MKKLLALLLALLLVLSVAACSDSGSGIKGRDDDDDDRVSDRDKDEDDNKDDKDDKDKDDDKDDKDDKDAEKTAKNLAEKFVTAVFEVDGSAMVKTMNEELFEAMAEADGITVKESKEDFVDIMEDELGPLIDMFDQMDSWDMDVSAEDVTDASSSELKTVRKDYEDVGVELDIEAMKYVTVAVEMDFDHEGEHVDADFDAEIPVIQIDGEWGVEFIGATTNLGEAMTETGEELQQMGSDEPDMPSPTVTGGKSTPEEAAEIYVRATFDADGELMMSSVPESVVQTTADQVNMTVDEFYDYFDEYLQEQLDSITDSIGTWTYEYTYDSTEDGDDDDIEAAQESYDELNLGIEIQDYKYVVYNVSIEGTSGSDNDDISVGVVQIGGKWFVDIYF